jgi:hypothetical protein
MRRALLPDEPHFFLTSQLVLLLRFLIMLLNSGRHFYEAANKLTEPFFEALRLSLTPMCAGSR